MGSGRRGCGRNGTKRDCALCGAQCGKVGNVRDRESGYEGACDVC
jgi:hypothetical protein